jgi:hypothetical protein
VRWGGGDGGGRRRAREISCIELYIRNTDVRPTRSGGQITNNRPHPDDAYNLRQFAGNGNLSFRENAKLSRFYKVLTIVDNTTKIIGFRDC